MTAEPALSHSSRGPGATLLHPLSLLALAVLVANDHVLKAAYPSALTGKLSDFAGVFLLPLALQAVLELAVVWRRGRLPARRLDNSMLIVCVAVTLIGFGLPELWPPADRAYECGMGVLQWPYHAATAALLGSAIPGVRPVDATPDLSDLAALPMALLALRLAWRERQPAPRRTRPMMALAAVCAWCSPQIAHADTTSRTGADRNDGAASRHRGERTHDGFYADVELGFGALLVDSDASVSNGFQQPLAASARGIAAPWLTIALGGTLRSLSLVIGGRYAQAQASAPVIDTLGQSFEVSELSLELSGIELFGRYYPDAKGGLSFGGALGYLRLGTGNRVDFFDGPSSFGQEQEGVSVSAESSYSFWISRQLSAGGSLRLLAARLDGQHGRTLLFAPALLGGLVWH